MYLKVLVTQNDILQQNIKISVFGSLYDVSSPIEGIDNQIRVGRLAFLSLSNSDIQTHECPFTIRQTECPTSSGTLTSLNR